MIVEKGKRRGALITMMRGEISLNIIIVRRCSFIDFALEKLAGSGRRGKMEKLCALGFEQRAFGLSAEHSANWLMQATAEGVSGAAALLVLRHQD